MKTKGTFHEKIGTIKDRNGMDLTEAEDIKKRWPKKKKKKKRRGGKNMQNNYTKKDLHDPDNHNGVIDHSPRARHLRQ